MRPLPGRNVPLTECVSLRGQPSEAPHPGCLRTRGLASPSRGDLVSNVQVRPQGRVPPAFSGFWQQLAWSHRHVCLVSLSVVTQPLSMCLSNCPSSYKDPCHRRSWAPPDLGQPHLDLITSAKTPFPNEVTFWGPADMNLGMPSSPVHHAIQFPAAASVTECASKPPAENTHAELAHEHREPH